MEGWNTCSRHEAVGAALVESKALMGDAESIVLMDDVKFAAGLGQRGDAKWDGGAFEYLMMLS